MRIFGFVSLILAVAIIGWWTVKSLTKGGTSQNAPLETEAVAKAKALYLQEKLQGKDFSQGPCLAEDLLPGWVADIAHNPREPIDDLPENQCQAYRQGKAQHFVELDTNGEVIRTH